MTALPLSDAEQTIAERVIKDAIRDGDPPPPDVWNLLLAIREARKNGTTVTITTGGAQ